MSARGDQPRTPVLRQEYRPPEWWVDHVELDFDLGLSETRIVSRMTVRRNPEVDAAPLTLSGAGLKTQRVEVDGEGVPFEERRDEALVVENVPERAVVTTEVLVHPDRNTALEGLYRSGSMLLTQCEAEGFRKITWFPDRPDVMATYRVRLAGDRERFPVLLSNGNCVETGELDDGRHFAVWDDPFPKPSYLFAVVAGELDVLEDTFTTRSGREVKLKIYSEAENISRLDHAMDSLKRSMAWDEARFGLEYDLDVFHVVATHDFNMGAMENKSLNIFNARYVLADRETATDGDYEGIESVIAHEYFHNWTGNRVTCRDWFQLTLKEGLTVYRDQEFTADQRSRGVKRIQDVSDLMARQFPEDAGPMAHPIRPERYVEINNFYTATVYEKGAQVVRMYETLLGRDGFRRGMDLYFERHDGQAVTCDDFRHAMADANDTDLEQFERWYRQVGTPRVEANTRFDEDSGELALTLAQSLPEHPDNRAIDALMIPVKVGFLDADNRPLPVTLAGETEPGPETRLLVLTEKETEFRFTGLPADALPSLLRDFSAPVKLDYDWSSRDLARLAGFDSDPFSRWRAMRVLSERVLGDWIEGRQDHDSELLIEAWAAVLEHSDSDPALAAELLSLPSEGELAQDRDPVDVEAIHSARNELLGLLGQRLENKLLERFETLAPSGVWSSDGPDAARRRLRNVALGLLAAAGADPASELASRHYARADNMTDRLAAFRTLVHNGLEGANEALADFEQRFAGDPLVMDKWFAVQATRSDESTVDDVRRLMEHEAFRLNNPNKVRALIGAMAMTNPMAFHRADGDGYRLIGEVLDTLDEINPQVGARLATTFNRWRAYDNKRSAMMKEQLQKLAAKKGLSPHIEEIVTAALRDRSGG
ncbi:MULTISPECIES: aminopeptidase N [unclassified Wenzhouxiangella]|uniref:aminopeptidase N n=1 Tax=unclassified Wenzhouxiangella TaxID=2613841 RepID=UPI000E329E52|nr:MULTISPECIES: aminopeptidase N [unclassified Wenzhouxiangella]RFF28536.1 aminopeptidase N [Wenzhouxiangella sp. 15181]RFP70054.1 aminopeptidase N [Wenzhouxiangella sp. 15190]